MNILIRRAEIGDAEGLHRCFMSPLVTRNTLQTPYRSVESVREQLTNSSPNDYHLVAEVDGEVVGSVGLHVAARPRINPSASLGMMVRDDYQGKGIGTALMQAAIELADKWLNLLRLELTVYTDNEAAVALYKQFGFEIEGTLRKYAFRDGEFVDVYTMARVR
jgi:putative acetyltransferase